MNNKDKLIIFIDDEEDITSSMEAILAFKDIQIKVFNDPEAAENFIIENHKNISVVITDQNMPKKTGLKLIQDLKSSGIDIPFIIASGGSSDISEEDKSIEHIQKPYSSDTLVSFIKKVS